MSSPKYLSSDTSESLPRSAFDEVNVPEIYDELGLDYEQYILEDKGRDQATRWVISKLSERYVEADQGLYVIDLGCASGRPTAETVANALRDLSTPQSSDANSPSNASKHVVMGVDISTGQLEHARRRVSAVNPIAHFALGDMRTWSPPASHQDGGVDAVLTYYALNHLPIEDYRAVLRTIATWLRCGGVLALGNVAYVNGRVKWLGYNVAATSLPLEELVRLVESTGFVIVESWEEEWESTNRIGAKGKLNQFLLGIRK